MTCSLFIVSYRTRDGEHSRLEVPGLSWQEVRALFRLKSGVIPGTLVVQPVREPTSGIHAIQPQ